MLNRLRNDFAGDLTWLGAFVGEMPSALADATRALADDPMGAAHLALDVAGVVDPWGVADGINAGLYLLEGDRKNAAISAAGALVPYAGDVLKATRIGKSVVRLAGKALDAAAGTKGIVRGAACRAASAGIHGVSGAAAGAAAGFATGGISGYYDGRGVWAGGVDGAGRGALTGLAGGMARGAIKAYVCFVAGTPVHTPTGTVAIEDLAPGDLVLAYDEATERVVAKPVLDVMSSETSMLVRLVVRGEEVWATKLHPFYLPDTREWVPACDLRAGMRLLTVDLEPAVIESAEHRAADEETYNLSVADCSTYFVGECGLLVHNSRFESRTKTFTEIYEVFDPANGKVVYVGQTTQGVDVRFRQHLEVEHTHWRAKGYRVRTAEYDTWTPYQAAVRERAIMEANGGKGILENLINPISDRKRERYKSVQGIC